MELVKKTQNTFLKSSDFREQYTSQNSSRPGGSTRFQQRKEKRFKRERNDAKNHSRSSSNCSHSSEISKFYVKNIVSLIPTNEIVSSTNNVGGQKQGKNAKSPQLLQKNVSQTNNAQSPNSPQKKFYNSYGLTSSSPNKQKKLQQKNLNQKSFMSNITQRQIDVTNYLQRQLSPNISSAYSPQSGKKRTNLDKRTHINGIQDSYNFLSPAINLSKKGAQLNSPHNINKDTKVQQTNRINQLNLELKMNKKQHAYYEENNGNGNKQKKGSGKNIDNGKENDSRNQSTLVTKLIQYEFENQKLKQTINKLKKQVQELQKQIAQTKPPINLQNCQSNPTQCQTNRTKSQKNSSPGVKKSIQPYRINNNNNQNMASSRSLNIPNNSMKQSVSISQITWDDKQFTDCLEQKQKQIIQLREQIKNLQIEINYLNRKWMNEVQRVKKIDKFQYMKLKDKYKEVLVKYKEKIKANYAFPPNREEFVKVNKMARSPKKNVNKQVENVHDSLQLELQPEIEQLNNKKPIIDTTAKDTQKIISPRRRKRNYTVDHLKGRGIMSDIKINYGYYNKVGNSYQNMGQLELLEYSSCEQDLSF